LCRPNTYGRDPTHTHHYMFEIGSMIIDATVKGNCSRFMNHSCEPNAVCEKWYVPRTPCAIDRIGFFAKRDIELGEEITFDYQFENYGREAQRCFCGTSACTGWIGKPPEMLDDDDELESPSEESGVSEEEEDEKPSSDGRDRTDSPLVITLQSVRWKVEKGKKEKALNSLRIKRRTRVRDTIIGKKSGLVEDKDDEDNSIS
uniref:Histone-lysine N-methyltransferase n=1 Tax=Heligmosomoides polygyrus TaxID=6339 RepID=A0A183FSK6_HELPZ